MQGEITLRELIERTAREELRHRKMLARPVRVLSYCFSFDWQSTPTDMTEEDAAFVAVEAFKQGRYRVLLEGRPLSSLDEHVRLDWKSDLLFIPTTEVTGL